MDTKENRSAALIWRLILIEDHAIYRNSVMKALAQLERYECVGSFSNMEDALDATMAWAKSEGLM